MDIEFLVYTYIYMITLGVLYTNEGLTEWLVHRVELYMKLAFCFANWGAAGGVKTYTITSTYKGKTTYYDIGN